MSMYRNGVATTSRLPQRPLVNTSVGASPPPASGAKVAAVSLGSFVVGTALITGGLYFATKGRR